MEKHYTIYQENGLFGAKDQMGNVVIENQGDGSHDHFEIIDYFSL